jgi:hypothetical protein
MSKFLANENVPIEAVELARQNGLDMAWIKEIMNADYLAQFMLTVLTQQVTWEGNFSVARERQLRVVPLPE